MTPAAPTKGAEFRRAWPVLLASAVGAAVSVSALLQYTMGAFIEPLTHEFGWSRGEVNALSLFKAIGMLSAAALMGGVADRIGARRVAITSQALLALMLAGMALAPGNILFFYIAYLLISAACAGTLMMIWARAIVGWFDHARGLALGIALMLVGLLGSLTPAYVTWLVEWSNWRTAYLGLAALPCISLPLTIWLFREPADPVAATGQPPVPRGGMTIGQVLRRPAFWQMGLAFMIGGAGLIAVMVNAIPMLTDRGVSRLEAASIAGLFGIAAAIGRVVTGALLDHFTAERILPPLLLLPACACLMLRLGGDDVLVCGMGITAVGFAAGMEADAAAYLAARYFGLRHFSTVHGLLYTLSMLGGGIGPTLTGYSHDRTGSYDAALTAGFLLFLLSGLLILLLRGPGKMADEGGAGPAPAGQLA